MPVTIKLKRGNSADAEAYVPKRGEPVFTFTRTLDGEGKFGTQSGVDCNEHWLYIGDGATAGGWPFVSANDIVPQTINAYDAGVHAGYNYMFSGSNGPGMPPLSNRNGSFSGREIIFNRGIIGAEIEAPFVQVGSTDFIQLASDQTFFINGTTFDSTNLSDSTVSLDSFIDRTDASDALPDYFFLFLDFGDDLLYWNSEPGDGYESTISSPRLKAIPYSGSINLITSPTERKLDYLFPSFRIPQYSLALGYITVPTGAAYMSGESSVLDLSTAFDWNPSSPTYSYHGFGATTDLGRYGRSASSMVSSKTYKESVITFNSSFPDDKYNVNISVASYEGERSLFKLPYVENKLTNGFSIISESGSSWDSTTSDFEYGWIDRVVVDWVATHPSL